MSKPNVGPIPFSTKFGRYVQREAIHLVPSLSPSPDTDRNVTKYLKFASSLGQETCPLGQWPSGDNAK